MIDYKPITAKSHTPPYRIHRYFARRPWNVFRNLIQNFSDKDDIILDPFCGGGVTIYEGLRLNRKVIGFDINPLSTFIIDNMIRKDINIQAIKRFANILLEYIRGLYQDFDTVKSQQMYLDNHKNYVDWYELAHKIYCNHCDSEIILANENKIKNGRYSCHNKKCEGNIANGGYVEPKNCQRNGYKYLYSVKVLKNRKRIISKVDKEIEASIKEHIEFLKRKIQVNGFNIPKDKIPLNWDRQNEDLLRKKNIYFFQDLFTKKNLLINLLLLNKIKSLNTSKETYEVLRFIFSNSIRFTNIMTFTNKGWASGKPNAWARHAYWIPSQFCEVNVIDAFKKSYEAYIKCLNYNFEQNYILKKAKSFNEILFKKNFYLFGNSLKDFKIPENSIDVIITDPPYGSNIQYLELSHFWYPWNNDLYDLVPNFSEEAVANRKKNFEGAKDFYDFEENLFKVFNVCFNALKSKGKMVLTFNNKDIRAWLALLISIFRAGFKFQKDNLIFQDGVKNYKQTAHTKAKGSPYGDFIYIFYKDMNQSCDDYTTEEEITNYILNQVESSLQELKTMSNGKNKIITDFFLNIIPKIETFVNMNKNNNHNLYRNLNKNLFKKFYQ